MLPEFWELLLPSVIREKCGFSIVQKGAGLVWFDFFFVCVFMHACMNIQRSVYMFGEQKTTMAIIPQDSSGTLHLFIYLGNVSHLSGIH